MGVPAQGETVETVELLASEVIANAVLHSSGPCDVVVTRNAERLRVEVTDTDPTLPSAVAAGPNDESGRGLWLVEALADAWGVRLESEGKTTWFEIRLEPSHEGLGDNPVKVPTSPHTVAVRRADQQVCLTRPVKSRALSVPATAGKRHQPA
ncbi:signal transduction histidine kinase regulatingcitrate/malate metabolism [Streptomyces iranensis]|uniref:Signal transduction histidine kinase regulatingcitrate/malate metabolism n=1 Tax=Streptomyces iranensis TaxID=576784 RepID=A0A061A370_9ACTN|nr:signal transduction histidine kinase regulatingcitrate/malate metabolism [Streptomyces iranensis]